MDDSFSDSTCVSPIWYSHVIGGEVTYSTDLGNIVGTGHVDGNSAKHDR